MNADMQDHFRNIAAIALRSPLNASIARALPRIAKEAETLLRGYEAAQMEDAKMRQEFAHIGLVLPPR